MSLEDSASLFRLLSLFSRSKRRSLGSGIIIKPKPSTKSHAPCPTSYHELTELEKKVNSGQLKPQSVPLHLARVKSCIDFSFPRKVVPTSSPAPNIQVVPPTPHRKKFMTFGNRNPIKKLCLVDLDAPESSQCEGNLKTAQLDSEASVYSSIRCSLSSFGTTDENPGFYIIEARLSESTTPSSQRDSRPSPSPETDLINFVENGTGSSILKETVSSGTADLSATKDRSRFNARHFDIIKTPNSEGSLSETSAAFGNITSHLGDKLVGSSVHPRSIADLTPHVPLVGSFVQSQAPDSTTEFDPTSNLGGMHGTEKVVPNHQIDPSGALAAHSGAEDHMRPKFGAVFGNTLSEITGYASCQSVMGGKVLKLPIIVFKCTEELYRRGLKSNGLLRPSSDTSGSDVDITASFRTLVAEFNSGPLYGDNLDLSAESPDDIGALLVTFLSCLRGRVIPAWTTEMLRKCLLEPKSTTNNEQSMIRAVQRILRLLPASNLSLFIYLLAFLSQVILNGPSNGWNTYSLACLFGKGIMCIQSTQMSDKAHEPVWVVQSQDGTNILDWLLRNWEGVSEGLLTNGLGSHSNEHRGIVEQKQVDNATGVFDGVSSGENSPVQSWPKLPLFTSSELPLATMHRIARVPNVNVSNGFDEALICSMLNKARSSLKQERDAHTQTLVTLEASVMEGIMAERRRWIHKLDDLQTQWMAMHEVYKQELDDLKHAVGRIGGSDVRSGQ